MGAAPKLDKMPGASVPLFAQPFQASASTLSPIAAKRRTSPRFALPSPVCEVAWTGNLIKGIQILSPGRGGSV